MILHNVHLFGRGGPCHIHISDGIIQNITPNGEDLKELTDELRIDLKGICATPGFINSHDHLDFNLYPQLGRGNYNNYTEWGNDIHANNKELIRSVERVPVDLRTKWGQYKNLLNGFTTVVNHGEKLEVDNSITDVVQDVESLHSPAFEKKWKWKLNHPLRWKIPVVMHVGEGVDNLAVQEVASLLNWNLFRRKVVAVHGVSMSENQVVGFTGLVWCPASNYFLFNTTAPVQKLKQKTVVVFGTDSTLTSPCVAQKHFSLALDTGMVSSFELYNMLTANAAELWKLADRGSLDIGKKADILIVHSLEQFFEEGNNGIQLVIKDGKIKMIADDLVKTIEEPMNDKLERIRVGNSDIWVKAGLKKLTTDILSYYPLAEIPFQFPNE